jgi:DNA-binding MarR family transcriptional regulator
MDFDEEFQKHVDMFDDSVMTELISFICKGYNSYLVHQIQELDITQGQIKFILLLKRNENASQEELAHQLFLSGGTAAKTLRKLDDENIIQRTVDPNNRRKYGVALTDKGKEIAKKIEKIDEDWEKSIYKNFRGDNKEIIMNILKELVISVMKTNWDWHLNSGNHHPSHHHDSMKAIWDWHSKK